MEEAALIDGQVLNEVILPMMSVPRRGPNGLVDQEEPHQQQIFIANIYNLLVINCYKIITMNIQN